jgi:BirA family biotin operon repressor/biotin-[acetyl-CoA-carboxylase] ligase
VKSKQERAADIKLNKNLKGPFWVLFLGELIMEKYNNFNQNKIQDNLKNNISRKTILKIYDKVDSTNNQAKDLIESSIAELKLLKNDKLFVFAADSQLAGRGRRGHSWLSSDPASMAVSFLFKPNSNTDKIPQITAAAALAVQDTFNFFDLKTVIKWPNDILVDHKKICGILSELVLNRKNEAFVVVGCGINLNNEFFASEIQAIATSYYLEKNKKINKNIFLARLIEKIETHITNYFSGSRENIINKWKKRLNLTGKKIDFIHNGEKQTGFIKEVLDSGNLLVVLADGREKELQSATTSLDYQSLSKYND